MKRPLFIGIFYHFFCMSLVFSMTPIESVILGDVSEKYDATKSDPLTYIFSSDKNKEKVAKKYKYLLAKYRGFIEEGLSLQNFCNKNIRIQYPSDWQHNQTLRTMYATLQHIGLDLMIKALPLYAKKFDFSEDEYSNLGHNLIGNYCSANLSSISLRELQNRWMEKFRKGSDFKLPSVDGNELFPPWFTKRDQERRLKQEFLMSIELFKSFCSWGSQVDDLRLLPPIIRNPAIMSFIIRQLVGLEFVWDESSNDLSLVRSDNTLRLLCRNYVCRKSTANDFDINFTKAIGSSGVESDLSALYCQEMANANLKQVVGQPPKISQQIKTLTFDEQNFMAAHFIALLTGVPDMLLGLDKFSLGKELVRSSVDNVWDKWAAKSIRSFSHDLYFEESITVELANRRYYFNPYLRNFRVAFDVNLGEFDRGNQLIGKIKSRINLNVSKSFLNWAHANLTQEDFANRKRLRQIVENKIHARVKGVIEDNFKAITWSKAIIEYKDYIINATTKEIIEQLLLYRESLWVMDVKGNVSIPIEFAYSPFAIRRIYINNRVKRIDEKK